MANDERGENAENSNISLKLKMKVESRIMSNDDEESLVQALCKGEGMKEDGGNEERNQDKGNCMTITEGLGKKCSIGSDPPETILTPAYGDSLCVNEDKEERGGYGNNTKKKSSTMDDRLENEDDCCGKGKSYFRTAPLYDGSKPRLSQMSPIRERILSISTSNALDNFPMVEV